MVTGDVYTYDRYNGGYKTQTEINMRFIFKCRVYEYVFSSMVRAKRFTRQLERYKSENQTAQFN